mgnify:CR=1 FL=1
MSSEQVTEKSAWLVELGREELRLVKELGWEHPAVLAAQERFRNGFLAVKAIRRAYEAPSSQEDN